MKTKAQKSFEADQRTASWNSLSTKEKLHEMDRRLGKGTGGAKQRARLEKQLSAENEERSKKLVMPRRPKKADTNKS